MIMMGDYLVDSRVYRVDEHGLVTYAGLHRGSQDGEPRGMKVAILERAGSRFKVSCMVAGLPPATRRFDTPNEAIGAADGWFLAFRERMAVVEQNRPIQKEPTPYEDLINERMVSADTIAARAERERKKKEQAPPPPSKPLPSFDDILKGAWKRRRPVSSEPAMPAIPPPAPEPAPSKPARLPSASQPGSRPAIAAQLESLWFEGAQEKPKKPSRSRRPTQARAQEVELELDDEESLEALTARYARELGDGDEPLELCIAAAGPTPREDLPATPAWLPATGLAPHRGVDAALRLLGRPLPATPPRPALLAAPRFICARPAVVEDVGRAARFPGLPLAELEMNAIPMKFDRRKVPPPKYYMLPLWEFPWLESAEMRARFVAALSAWSGSRPGWVEEQIERREIHHDLVHVMRPVVRLGRAWGAIPATWPPMPAILPTPPLETEPAPPPTEPALTVLEPVLVDPIPQRLQLEAPGPVTPAIEPTPRARRVARAQELTPQAVNRRLEWTPEEEGYLREHFGSQPVEDIAAHLDRTVCGIRNRAKRLRLTQKRAIARKELYPATAIAGALRVDQKCVIWWGELGLRIEESPIAAGKRSCRVIAIKDLVAFLNQRPELFDPKRADLAKLEQMGGKLEPDVVTPPWRWKRMICPAAEHHATGLPLAFYAPLRELAPHCPCCGRKLGRQAVGSFAERYKQRARGLEAWQLVTSAGAMMLQIIADAGGRTDITRVADIYRGGIAELDEMQVTRKVLTRMTTKQIPLLTLEARPVKGSKKGEARVFFTLTDKGRAVLQMLNGLQQQKGVVA